MDHSETLTDIDKKIWSTDLDWEEESNCKLEEYECEYWDDFVEKAPERVVTSLISFGEERLKKVGA